MLFGFMFNFIDAAAVIVVILAFLIGLRRGLSGELFPFLSVLINLLAGIRFYLPLSDLLLANTRLSADPELARAMAFLAIIVVLGLFLLIVRIVLHIVMKTMFSQGTNRAGGGVLGLARGTLTVILLVFAIGLWPNNYTRQLIVIDSFIGRTVFKAAPLLSATSAFRPSGRLRSDAAELGTRNITLRIPSSKRFRIR